MSKFDYGTFSGGYDDFAVSKEKYTKEQAIELYCIECDIPKDMKIAVMDAFVRHKVGWDEDNERCCGMKTERIVLWGTPKPSISKEILKEILKTIEETKGGAE